MIIREYTESDLDALRAMHARQGFDYTFPDLADPIFVSKLVLDDDEGRPIMASLARLTCEMYLLMDRDNSRRASPRDCRPEKHSDQESAVGTAQSGGTSLKRAASDGAQARRRYDCMLALHAAGERDLFARGLDDAHAWLPPAIAKRFGRRLEALGWVRDDAWTPYCRRLRSPGR
ncbi:MAG: hypothetical protein ACRD4X_09700 [Candidatus Acidiferrales bacterium]